MFEAGQVVGEGVGNASMSGRFTVPAAIFGVRLKGLNFGELGAEASVTKLSQVLQMLA
ncbi:hypothetical protein ACIBQX_19410 [Nonomuraea sp. NPDC049714]|uniref:hypothetical protein n=1 Tax=Nonomuraea sp. NPDC049714 TaxID=3364357 RepID=UPI00378EAAB5